MQITRSKILIIVYVVISLISFTFVIKKSNKLIPDLPEVEFLNKKDK